MPLSHLVQPPHQTKMNKLHYCCLPVLVCCLLACSRNDSELADEAASYVGPEYESSTLTYGVDTIATDLKNPWGIAFLPDGRMLVTERAGEVLIFENGQQLPETIKIPDVYVNGQGGLMDIKLHPDYENNGWIYLSYSKVGEGGGGTVIARTKMQGNTFEPLEELFAATPLANSHVHFG